MSEVTAEMIARGRGADPESAAQRRRLASRVREAREKLTSSGTGHRAFDVELLHLFAVARQNAAAPTLGLAVVVALMQVADAITADFEMRAHILDQARVGRGIDEHRAGFAHQRPC